MNLPSSDKSNLCLRDAAPAAGFLGTAFLRLPLSCLGVLWFERGPEMPRASLLSVLNDEGGVETPRTGLRSTSNDEGGCSAVTRGATS